MSSHKCAVDSCTRQCSIEHLMCIHHWKRVSVHTQRQIYKSMRAVQAGTLESSVYYGWVEAAKKEAA